MIVCLLDKSRAKFSTQGCDNENRCDHEKGVWFMENKNLRANLCKIQCIKHMLRAGCSHR